MKYLQELNPFTKDYVSDFLYLKNPIIAVKKEGNYKKLSITGSRLDLIVSETSNKPYYLSPNIDNTIRKVLINKEDKGIKNKYTLIEIYSMNLTIIGKIEEPTNITQKINYDFDTEKKDYYIIEVDDEEEFINDKKYIKKLYNFYKKIVEGYKEYPQIGKYNINGEIEYTPKYQCDEEYKKYGDNLNVEDEINLLVNNSLTRNYGIFSPEANLIFYQAELSEWGKPNYKRYKLEK